ncbi:hypothetical protein [Niabella aquatica]
MHLLYLTFGNNNRNHIQAYFSILSFFAKNIPLSSINIITDKPSYYKSIENRVHIIAVDDNRLEEWKGPHRFFWRVKIKAIETLCTMYKGAPVLYLDSDTFAYADAPAFTALAQSSRAAMFENEGPLKKLRSKTMKAMAAGLKGVQIAGMSHFPDREMWNAGVVFTPNYMDNRETDLAITLCDEMCRLKVKDPFIEQFALSVALHSLYGLQPADAMLAHYWSAKQEWDEVIKNFFIENKMCGLSFEEEVQKFRNIDISKYPVVTIARNTNRRLKQVVDSFWGYKKVQYLFRDKNA